MTDDVILMFRTFVVRWRHTKLVICAVRTWLLFEKKKTKKYPNFLHQPTLLDFCDCRRFTPGRQVVFRRLC